MKRDRDSVPAPFEFFRSGGTTKTQLSLNMFNAIALGIQFCFASTNLLQSENSVKILNTENVILSLGDFEIDRSDELEKIKNDPKDPDLNKKLNKFHKFVKINQMPDEPTQKFFHKPNLFLAHFSNSEIIYPDSPIEIAADRKDLSKLERRRRKKKKHSKWRKMGVGLGKRELATSKSPVDIEADHLAIEYFDFVAESQKNNTAYKYSDQGKPEENLKEVIDKITNVKIPQNCKNMTGVGIQAVECLVKMYKNKEINDWDMFKKVSIILLVWFSIYLAVALPLWCTKGWCCCCCRCAFCLPGITVKEIHKYIAQNPPGVYVNAKGEEEHYNPSIRETELYERLKRAISDF